VLLINANFEWSRAGVHKSWVPGHMRTNLCMVVLNIFRSSTWDLMHVTNLVPVTVKWLLDFWKICAHLV